jgi:ABC-type antimicrobial peptide transport system permease subunit
MLFLFHPETMEMHLSSPSNTQRFETLLISTFASIALFLSGLGLYATLPATVAARTREIGLRMAIGAAIALITARSLSTTGWWRPLLFGVSWFDPKTYVTILLVLGAVSFAACFPPTWRATRIDPMQILRDE